VRAVFDLPAVLDAGTPLIFSDGGVSHDRLSTVAGDFFDAHSLPEGDVYVLSRILHDWDDDKALLILQNVYRVRERSARTRDSNSESGCPAEW
jgi:hypothetical protein